MTDDGEPDPYTEPPDEPGCTPSEDFTVPDDAHPDPIIGPLAERAFRLPEAEFNALRDRLTPTDRQAFFDHLALAKKREELVTSLWDSLLEGHTPGNVPTEMRGAELQMQMSTHAVLRKLAWKLVLHMRGQEETEGQTTAAFNHLYAGDPEFRELAENVATRLQWQRALPPEANE